jgi:hypothetical protein
MDPIKKIGIGIFILIIIICIIYFVFLRPTSNDNNSGQGKDKDICGRCQPPNTCNKNTGQCISPDTCGGNAKPQDDKNYYCFKGNWTLNTNIKSCNNSYLPTDIGSCSLETLKCENSILYCPTDKTICNSGDLYFYELNNNKCLNCPTGFNGPTCNFSDKDCKNGKINTDGSGNCICPNNTYYGDKCEYQCTGDGKIYDNYSTKCICDPILYDVDGDGCKKKECGYGKLNTSTGKCDCTGGYSGDKCDNRICNDNQDYNITTNVCVCKQNINGSQYYGTGCTGYNCNLATEFNYDISKGPSCDCSKDVGSCGKFCEFTRKLNCNDRGNTNCNANNDFVSCKCESGWTGTNCQCKDDKPKDTNPCLGIDFVCGVSGDWVPSYKDCNELIGSYNNGIQGWSEACFSTIFEKDNYMVGKISKCEDNTKNNYVTKNCSPEICAIPLGCPKIPQTPCEKGKGKVNLCDESTTYNWSCVDQIHNKTNGNCPPLPQGAYCIKEDGITPDPPMCFQCGPNGGSEWICQNEGALPSESCSQDLGIKINNNITGFAKPIYTYSQDSNLPIYPTTDRNQCLNILKNVSQGDPFFNGQISTYNIAKTYGNPIGTFDQQSTSFTDLDKDNTNRYFIPNTNYNSAKCLLKDEDILNYIIKGNGTLCSGNGTFKQDIDSNGHYLPSGSCSCTGGYVGNNCQFSSYTTCNSSGEPTYAGLCTCKKGYAGNTCQFSRQDCGGGVGFGDPVSSDDGKTLLRCNCDGGYIGNTCQFSNSNCNKSVKSNYPFNITGVASVDVKDNLICDYSQTCGVPLDSDRDKCRLLVAAFAGDDKTITSGNYFLHQTLYIDSNYINYSNSNMNINFINTGGFNGIVFTTKPIGGGIWNSNNYKITAVYINNNPIGVPGGEGGQGRAFSYYIPIKDIASNYFISVESREGGNSKIMLFVYLTMETSAGSW